MYQEYITLYKQYTQKYGPKTAIFLMVGSFYELYDVQNKETGETTCNVRDIVDYLGIQLTTKKGDYSANEDGLFAGFPDYVLHKWAGRLTSAGWTVVIVDQIKDIRGKVKERKVSRILSPATHIENIPSTETPYVITLYLYPALQGQPPFFGAAALDLTTGSTHTYSGITQGRADLWTADDFTQFISVFSPKELLVHCMGDQHMDEITLRRQFGLPTTLPIHLRFKTDQGAFANELVRTEYLQTIYTIRSLLPPRTYLGLRTEHEESALLCLLQYVEEHYPSMLRSFHRNEPWVPHLRLICGNHALTQLQMTGANPNECVIGLFDKGITPMGKRAIRERLVMPYSSASDIQSRLAEVQEYLSWEVPRAKSLERQLRFMHDLPRLHRRVLCGLVQWNEFAHLFQSYRAMEAIDQEITRGTRLCAPYQKEEWMSYLQEVCIHFSEEKAFQVSSDSTPFSLETYPDIGEKEAEIQTIIGEINALRAQFAETAGVSVDAIRMEEREREPYGFKSSSVVLQQLKKKMAALPEGTRLSELKSGGWIDCNGLQQLNTRLQKARDVLCHLSAKYLPDACKAISSAGHTMWSAMECWISHVDATQCIGRVSLERGWSCPQILDTQDADASVDIVQLRHPLVEATASRTAYVKHNISLGESDHGWLVYGMNASGKSTLMKATGLCILLAQAGCYVPAQKMTLQPFQAIYTRILNQDNLFAGLSSFAVEMSELRDILRNATSNTLVLGDELCAGTESTSAQALVASGIQWLTQRRAKFIFATHLHDLPKWIDLASSRIAVWHLHVEYNPLTQKLIYDRSLRPGSGSTLYGLEVARAMDLPFEFIDQALQIRHRIQGSTTQEKATTSSWNHEVTRTICEVCRSNMVSGLEVHHIQPRASASSTKQLADGSFMNDARNLMVICQTCHDHIHANKISVHPIQQTSDGPERMIQYTEEKSVISPQKGRWTSEEWETVKNTLQKYSSLSLKSMRAYLSSTHGIEMSESVLSRTRQEMRGGK